MPNAQLVGRAGRKARALKDGINVCGVPRSGTTLMYCCLRATVQGYEFGIKESSGSDAGQISKQPHGVFRPPCRRLIIMYRDPRGIVTSHHAASKFAESPHYFIGMTTAEGSVAQKTVLQYSQAIADCLAREDLSTVLIAYEDLLADPDKVQRVLGQRFRLTFEGSFKDFYKQEHGDYWDTAANGIRPLSRPRNWRRHKERIVEQFAEPEARALVRDWKYEVDDGWYESIAADLKAAAG